MKMLLVMFQTIQSDKETSTGFEIYTPEYKS